MMLTKKNKILFGWKKHVYVQKTYMYAILQERI